MPETKMLYFSAPLNRCSAPCRSMSTSIAQSRSEIKIPNPKMGVAKKANAAFSTFKSIITSAQPKGQGTNPVKKPISQALLLFEGGFEFARSARVDLRDRVLNNPNSFMKQMNLAAKLCESSSSAFWGRSFLNPAKI